MTRTSLRAEATPAELYGPLLAAVQARGIFADGKTFADAVAKRPVDAIMADFFRLPDGNDALLRFVISNFDLPSSVDAVAPDQAQRPLRDYIRATWPLLARDPQLEIENSSALPVRHRHAVPGGRFREIYYWDSFFTMLGLIPDGEIALANGIVDAMTDLIEDYGHIPNGSRTYYLGRSQPPLFHMMVGLLDNRRPAVAARRLAAMKREHAWWMAGAEQLAPGDQAQHVARLPDGSMLNRYWDPHTAPRDESWREDVTTASHSGRPHGEVYRNLRAGAESGWDFSSRWLAGVALPSIRTISILPVDLNAFLYGLECAIAAAEDREAHRYRHRADRRRLAMHQHMWNGDKGFFADFDLEASAVSENLTAACLAPLLAGLATQEQADQTEHLTREHLLAPGGLRTTLVETGEQWDRPNGWAPLQWIAAQGLKNYGHNALAQEIARRWIATVDALYARTGLIYEKYDVDNPSVGRGGEYVPQVGFGWTNGVTASFMDERSL